MSKKKNETNIIENIHASIRERIVKSKYNTEYAQKKRRNLLEIMHKNIRSKPQYMMYVHIQVC